MKNKSKRKRIGSKRKKIFTPLVNTFIMVFVFFLFFRLFYFNVGVNRLILEDTQGASVYTKAVIINPTTGAEEPLREGVHDVLIKPENIGIEEMMFNDLDVEDIGNLKIEKVSKKLNLRGVEFSKVYVIDASGVEFNNAKVTAIASSTQLYKCKDWDSENQECAGKWKKIMSLQPGEEYSFDMTPGDPGYGEINITGAEHLDENYNFISDIFDEVKEKDDLWSEAINDSHFVRVTYSQHLGNGNVIDVYVRNNNSDNTYFNVYPVGETSPLLGTSGIINSDTGQLVYITLENVPEPSEEFDFEIIGENSNSYLEFDYIHDQAIGVPITTLNFFMASEGFRGSDAGVDANSFDECPIVLNDYGNTTEKCDVWDCSAWLGDKLADEGVYCIGGWNCTSWNNETTCSSWDCLGWGTSTSTYLDYCLNGWDCLYWKGSVCETWNCTDTTWEQADQKDEAYCTGVWDCTNWNGDYCDTWDCTVWDETTYNKIDRYCSGVWDCTVWDGGGSCDTWDCTEWSSSAQKADAYCTGVWDCTVWNGDYCDTWSCTGVGEGAQKTDIHCDTWDCTSWNGAYCDNWDCTNWLTPAADELDYYCSGGYDCTNWKVLVGVVVEGLDAPYMSQTVRAVVNATVVNWDNVAHNGVNITLNMSGAGDVSGWTVEPDWSRVIDFPADTTVYVTFNVTPPSGATLGTYTANVTENSTNTSLTDSFRLLPAISGTAKTTLNWFMYSSDIRGGDGGVDANAFDESPIVLNDYGTTDLKCEMWNCTGWSATGAASDTGAYCSGGWSCSEWANDITCVKYECGGWTTTTLKYLDYCLGGFNCTKWRGTTCEDWDCVAWEQADQKDEAYCTGVWDCANWEGDYCETWNCTAWDETTYQKIDRYCIGKWDCTVWGGSGLCDTWNCVDDGSGDWASATAKADNYCINGYNCTSWNGDYCDNWDCLGWAEVLDKDQHCDAWNCSYWDSTKEVCETWLCLNWLSDAGTDTDFYCSEGYECFAWEEFPDAIPPLVYLETPLNNTLNTTTNTPEFFFNVTDETATTLDCTLWLENSTGIEPYGTNTTVVNFTSSNFTANESLANEDHWWWVNCTDGTNTNKSEVRNISINVAAGDTTPPIVYLETPLNNTINTTTRTPEFFFNVTDDLQTILKCTLWLENSTGIAPYGTNTTVVNFTSSNFTANASLANDDYWWWVNCTDGEENMNKSEVRNISINIITYEILITGPANGTDIDRDRINASVDDNATLVANLTTGYANVNVTFIVNLTQPSIAGQQEIVIGNQTTNASGMAAFDWNGTKIDGEKAYAGNYTWWPHVDGYTTNDSRIVYLKGGLNVTFRYATIDPNTTGQYNGTDNDAVEIHAFLRSFGPETMTQINTTYNAKVNATLMDPDENEFNIELIDPIDFGDNKETAVSYNNNIKVYLFALVFAMLVTICLIRIHDKKSMLNLLFLIIIILSVIIFIALSKVSIASPRQPDNRTIGYKFLDDGEVLHIWNEMDDYYFNATSGMQFSNHYQEYWTHNIFCFGFVLGANWNDYCIDVLDIDWNIDTDNATYINVSGSFEAQLTGRKLNFTLTYSLENNDTELGITGHVKNTGNPDIDKWHFIWKTKDIQIDNTTANDSIRIWNSTGEQEEYLLNQTLNKTYTNLSNGTYYLIDKKYAYLAWNKSLNYTLQVKNESGQYNAPVTLTINFESLASGEENSTKVYWRDLGESVRDDITAPCIAENFCTPSPITEDEGVYVNVTYIYSAPLGPVPDQVYLWLEFCIGGYLRQECNFVAPMPIYNIRAECPGEPGGWYYKSTPTGTCSGSAKTCAWNGGSEPAQFEWFDDSFDPGDTADVIYNISPCPDTGNGMFDPSDIHSQGSALFASMMLEEYLDEWDIDNEPDVTLVSPGNGTTVEEDYINFSCIVLDDYQINNITFYWNYTGVWEADGTINTSGIKGYTAYFYKANLTSTAIKWNCLAYDNESLSAWADANWSVIVSVKFWNGSYGLSSSSVNGTWNATLHSEADWFYGNKTDDRNFSVLVVSPDSTPPIVYLETPLNNTLNTTTNIPEFFFNVTDDLATTLDCTLWIENSTGIAPYGTNTTVVNFTSSNFTANESLANEDHWWWINCSDGINMNKSEVRNISIMAGDTVNPVINEIYDGPDPVDPGDIINISANVTDDVAVDAVFVTINDAANYTMLKFAGDTSDWYNYSAWDTNVSPGTYDYDVYANDTSGNNATISSGTLTVNTEVSLTLSQTPADFGNVSIPITNWQAFNGTTGTGHPQAGAARGYPTVTSNTGNVAENFSIRGSTNLSGAINDSYAIGIGNITWANNSNTTAVKLSTTDTLVNWNIAMGDYSNMFFWISIPEGYLQQTYIGAINVSATKYAQ